jgi:acyl-CoA reductase-like NAD-dependent aldehyde dehydrogenase
MLVRNRADSLAAEIVPLVEACRYLERNAARLLQPRRFTTRLHPVWLAGVGLRVYREPLGVVLILGPWNYPLLLPGVQTLQSLAAGNAVVLKPGRSAARVALVLRDILVEAGVPASLVAVLDEAEETGYAATEAGVDKVFLTGSAQTGEQVLRQLSKSLTPAVMELSGCDAVYVREDADLELVIKALRFGLSINGGATCIAPRRVFVSASIAAAVESSLTAMARTLAPWPVPLVSLQQARRLVDEAERSGARVLTGRIESDRMSPVIIANARPEMSVLQTDVMAPLLGLVTVSDDGEALAAAAACPYSLGATIFGSEKEAHKLACRVRAGVVVINDMIVPTADPRLSFGGRGRSGYGVTRGPEGLLEMTRLKTVAVRRSSWRPHLEDSGPDDERLFRSYLAAVHGGKWRGRLSHCRELLSILMNRARRA